MDGKELSYRLRQLINEDANSDFIDSKTTYQYLWEAARDFTAATNALRSSQSITTVASQQGYTLNANFGQLYLRNDDNEFVIKYNNGTTETFLPWKAYQEIIYENQTAEVSVPSYFTLIDDPTLDTKISSTTTSAGAATAGESTLTDTAADFSDVSAGDIVHNTADGSDGIVLSKTSTTVLVTALFGGTDNDWTSGDAYVIQPQGRLQLYLNQPLSTASHTITVYYTQVPPPVFSDYGTYRFQQGSTDAIIKYAAWLYKYRDKQQDFGDALFTHYERQLRRINAHMDAGVNKNKMRVSFRTRNNRNGG